MDNFQKSQTNIDLPLIALGFIGLALCEGSFTFMSGRLAALTSEGTTRRLRNYLFDPIQNLSFTYHAKTETGNLVERATSNVYALRRFFSDQAIGIGRIFMLFTINFISLLNLNGTLALISIIVVPFVLTTSLFFFRRVSKAYEAHQEQEARLVGAHEFITTFSKGYAEPVGEGGNLLSVGQKQLISLAHAVLAKPEIFIMDEATSSVDTLTEALIQRGMEALIKGRTSFVIAHRLSTIKHASRIVVNEEGRIAEMGTHADLLRPHGKYYQLFTRHFRRQLEEVYEPFIESSVTQVK